MARSSTQEKNLQELLNFEEALNSCFELYSTGRSITDYHFGSSRTLKDVFAFVITEEGLRAEAIAVASRLFISLEKEITRSCDLFQDRRMILADRNVFARRLSLFWHIFCLLDLDGFIPKDIEERMHSLHHAIDLALASFPDKDVLKALPQQLCDSLRCTSPVSRLSPVHLNGAFAREDGVITSIGFSRATKGDEAVIEESTGDGEQNAAANLLQQLQKCADGLSSGSYDVCLMEELTCPPELRNSFSWSQSDDILQKTLSSWDCVLEAVDRRVPLGAMRMLRVLLEATSAKNEIIKCFHSTFISKDTLPAYLKTSLCPNGESELNSCINELGDHNEDQRKPEKMATLSQQFAWLFMISPKKSLWRLLQRCVNDRRIVTSALKLMTPLASIRTLLSPATKRNLILDVVRHIIEEESDLSSADQSDTLIYIVASLTRQKRGDETSPLLSASTIFNSFCEPYLLERDKHKMTFAFSLMLRLFCAGETKLAVFSWTRDTGENIQDDDSETVRAPELVCLLFDKIRNLENDDSQAALFETTKKTLKQLGAKLKDDEVVFGDETIAFVSAKWSDSMWYVKVAVTEWLAFSLKEPKRQIPTGLFLSLSSEQAEQFEQIVVSYDYSPVECFLRSLFEISLWDSGFAIDVINKGLYLLPNDDNLIDKMALAQADVCVSARSSAHLAAFLPLIQRLLVLLDPTHSDVLIEKISATLYHSLRCQEALHVLAAGVKVALYSAAEEEPPEEAAALRRGGLLLLQTFAEHAKAHIERAVIDYRRSIKYSNLAVTEAIPLPENARRAESVLSQLSALFPLAVSFTHLVDKVPTSLQVLLSLLADYLSEFFSSRPQRYLDDAPPGNVQDTTVYAVSQHAISKPPAVSLPSPSHNGLCSPHDGSTSGAESLSSAGGHSAANPLFNDIPASAAHERLPRRMHDSTQHRPGSERFGNRNGPERGIGASWGPGRGIGASWGPGRAGREVGPNRSERQALKDGGDRSRQRGYEEDQRRCMEDRGDEAGPRDEGYYDYRVAEPCPPPREEGERRLSFREDRPPPSCHGYKDFDIQNYHLPMESRYHRSKWVEGRVRYESVGDVSRYQHLNSERRSAIEAARQITEPVTARMVERRLGQRDERGVEGEPPPNATIRGGRRGGGKGNRRK